jgi:hypothetical protein
MRRRVWIEPCPGVALPAIELGPICARFPALGRRYIYRDFDHRCRRFWILGPDTGAVMERWVDARIARPIGPEGAAFETWRR